ncbi:Vitamin B12 transporter BtuB [Paraburkholderia domus]|uniref:Vitamin B12 transporter BtuB n=1 Tax=Paraburkholderia domus TaxID=2793075 RepID=A0A9N8QYB6_9BURK|nr:TonB-dependent receptor [Paraburkholderia domus]MBK5050068.1 TonB-dependent receptor [Burkholderia sp. R-70006]MBK5064238.1 TonB-dependent receptor [Burkholderia sp. R-70199]MBK5086803.1 TonB-dependent receptor [Burkholderia sp. R-69927]MBK5121526.1 TonB-dependent receptor [Burkholderia sp. R-69980]MBK5166669.1 TonB-dependent receptor [Burkholderia sp. R-70211]MBK5185351.1 TonB-dependent receptor [Burkholderia sp. R-69749]MCI0147190.1 TonB-dependent receptor [Paraburkholderia sediminicola
MKQRALALAIKRIIWAELALSAVIAVPAFAQSQPATTGTAAGATTESTPAAAAAPAPASGTAATPSADNNTATPAGKGVQQLKKFEVTGSLIRSSDKVGFNQVQTITQKDIQNSGATTVADFLRDTSANSANSWSEGQSGNFAAGAAGIALRGLSEKYTLVLVDGQRVAPFAFFSNSVDSFFDLNTLPLNSIDRIEIVKTGAVSQYGSDAIAGVVNIITKHDFQGLQLDGSYGSAINGGGGAGTTKFGVLGGFGDLNSDRFNVTAAASYYKSNGFTLADRDSTRNQDFTNQPGGLSLLAPSYWSMPGGGVQALNNCPFGGSVRPAATNSLTAGSAGTVCGFNTAEGMSIAPMTERLNAKLHADFKVSDTTTAFGDFLISSNTTTTNDGLWNNVVGNPQVPTLIWNPQTKLLSPFNTTVPASNPYNPFGAATPLTYAFPNTVSEKTYATYWRASTGIKGSFNLPNGEWDWATSVSHSQSTVANTYTNQLNAAALTNIYQNGTLNFANPSATPNAFNGLYMDADNLGISKLDTVDATLSTPELFHLPAGDVGLGFGAQFTHQSEVLNPGGAFEDGLVNNPNLQTVNGQRNVGAVYYQVDIPIVRNLTFSQSGRYDHYSDVGGAFSPRFALRYQPVQALTMYTSYDRGFRAPTFVEDSKSQTMGIQVDPNTGQNYTSITEGNPNLSPERTRNINIGFQLSPTRTTDVGFDWYKIRVDSVIGQGAPSQVVTDPATGVVLYKVIPYQNLGYLDTNGFEGTFRQSLPTKTAGTFTLSGDWAYVNSFKLGFPGASPVNGAGNNFTLTQPFGGSFPRWKGNTTVDWTYHKFDAALTWQFTGPYAQNLNPNGPNKVGSYSQFNLMMTYTGFKHWTIYGGIDNIFNRTPPYDPIFANGTLDQNGYDQSIYTYIGRFAQIGATYKF